MKKVKLEKKMKKIAKVQAQSVVVDGGDDIDSKQVYFPKISEFNNKSKFSYSSRAKPKSQTKERTENQQNQPSPTNLDLS